MNPRLRPKRVLPLILVAVLGVSMLAVASAWGGPWGGYCGGGGWGGGANLTPEQSAKVSDLRQKFFNDTVNLRQQMIQKRAELAALWQAATPDEAKIAAKQKELNVLRDQMQQKGLDFQMQARKIAPGAANCPGPGMGPGMGMGQGMGMSRGW
jgi:zinc resistance-associated protein